MSRKIAFAFPGQGSQQEKMGLTMLSLFQAEVEQASDLLGYDVQAFLEKADAEMLRQTEFTQPLVFIVSALATKLVKQQGVAPDVVLGHSVGEYAALFAAGVLSFEDALSLVQQRALFMKEANQKERGGMIAILGKTQQEVEEFLASLSFPVYIANINEEKQIVVSASEQNLSRLSPALRENKFKHRELQVSAPFHSPLMSEAARAFAPAIEAVSFQVPACPVICNVTGQATTDAAKLRTFLGQQLNRPVMWLESLRTLEKEKITFFLELGPGKVLGKIARRFCAAWQIVSFAGREDLDMLPCFTEESGKEARA